MPSTNPYQSPQEQSSLAPQSPTLGNRRAPFAVVAAVAALIATASQVIADMLGNPGRLHPVAMLAIAVTVGAMLGGLATSHASTNVAAIIRHRVQAGVVAGESLCAALPCDSLVLWPVGRSLDRGWSWRRNRSNAGISHVSVGLFVNASMMAAILCAAILPTVGVLRAQEWKVTFEEPANKLALLPDERLIAVALGRGTGLLQEPRPCDVVLLDMASGAERQVLKGNLDGVRTVAYSRRHRLLASGGYDGHVRLWDISKGELIADISPEVGSILAMTFAPNERSLVMSGWRGNQDEIADSLLIWDVIEQRQDKKREMKLNAVIDLAVAPDGLHLASCSLDGTVAIWTLPTLDPAKVLLRAVASVSSISFSPDGAVLAVAHDPRPFNPAQGSVELWDAKTWQKVSTIAFSGPVATVRFSLDGNYLVAGGGGVRKLELWDRKAAKLAGSVAADDADVSDICVLPAGRSLIVAQKDGSVERWRFAHIRNGN